MEKQNRYIIFDSLMEKEIARLTDIEIRTILMMRDGEENRKEFDRIFGIKERKEWD